MTQTRSHLPSHSDADSGAANHPNLGGSAEIRSASPPAPAISTRALSLAFGRTLALDRLDLDIPAGAIYALVGPNGAGKTSLIKILLNILRPTSGTADVLGLPSIRISGRALSRVAYVSENQELPDWMTVTGLLRYLRPFYPTWDLTLEANLIRQFDLPPSRRLKHLSRGQRMKAALLSVLPYRPDLIVLDEPFSGLDPLVRDELIEGLLDRISPTGNSTDTVTVQDAAPTILISSHDLAEIENLASHIGYLDRGRLLFSEEIATLTSRFREITVTLGPRAAVAAPANPSPTYPGSWLLPEPGPSLFRFIHAHADTESVPDQVAAHLPHVANIDAQPMSLRSIFLALAKSTRHTPSADPSQAPAQAPTKRGRA